MPKKKSYTQKAAALTELWTEKRKSFTFTQLELQKAEERKQAQKPVLEQRRNNLLEAVKLAEERDIQKNRFHTQKKNREEITKKLLDAQEKMRLYYRILTQENCRKLLCSRKL